MVKLIIGLILIIITTSYFLWCIRIEIKNNPKLDNSLLYPNIYIVISAILFLHLGIKLLTNLFLFNT